MTVQVFVYPEELAATGPDALAAHVAELGCDAVSMALVYHRGRRVFPRQRRVSVLTGTTVYFEPDPARYGALAPVGNAPLELREAVRRFRGACDRRGLAFRAWIVALHNDGLAAAHPEAAAHSLDGAPTGVGLCPSAPEAVAFAAALVGDCCAQLGPDAVDLEAGLYPAWEPSYTLTLALEPLSEHARLLGAQCFCAACRALIGPEADALEARARSAAGPPFGEAGDGDDPAAGLAAVRVRGAARLVEAVAAAAHAHGSALRVFGSGPPAQAALQGLSAESLAAADAVLLGCGPLRGDELVERFRGLRALAGGRPATVSTNWTPERTPDALAADVARLPAEGADGLALYNLTLVPDAGLRAFRSAAHAFRAALAA